MPALLLVGCASFPVNPPLERVEPGSGYRLENLELGPGNSEETFVIVSLSGGGMRAAALDYGVLRELRRVMLPGGGSLLDELDILSSSSMASLVAAYYGLYGKEAFFERFEEEVLGARMQSAYTRKILAPWQWPRLWSPRFGRSELAESYLDRRHFKGATFADLPRVRPLILLGATDMSLGNQFAFVQAHFDRLCSDLDRVSLARGVTASLAFTGAFTPVTFRNYPSSDCGFTTPPMVAEALEEGPGAGMRQYERARNAVSYEDESRAWIHLLDGGVADNIGMRAVKLALTTRDTPWSIADRIASGTVRRLVVLIVDARSAPDLSRDRKPRAPGLTSAVLTSAGSPLSNYSTETIEVVRDALDDIADRSARFGAARRACVELAADRCDDSSPEADCLREALARCHRLFGLEEAVRPPDPQVYFIHARLDLVGDEALRTQLRGLPTSLQLPPEEVEALIQAAPEILAAIPDFRRLVRDLEACESGGQGSGAGPPASLDAACAGPPEGR